jgi:hypothetical protein
MLYQHRIESINSNLVAIELWTEIDDVDYANCANAFQAIDEFKKGKVEFRVDKTGIAHIPFGKVNFPEEDLIANFMAVVVRYLLQ